MMHFTFSDNLLLLDECGPLNSSDDAAIAEFEKHFCTDGGNNNPA